jgi:hypothetical protein
MILKFMCIKVIMAYIAIARLMQVAQIMDLSYSLPTQVRPNLWIRTYLCSFALYDWCNAPISPFAILLQALRCPVVVVVVAFGL